MLFNSFPFIFIFLPLSFFVYRLLNRFQRAHASTLWLLLCSLFFYAYWDVRYLPLLLASILFNFLIGQRIASNQEPRGKKTMLVIGVVLNILLLGYFKYAHFFLENVNWLLQKQHAQAGMWLPLGLGVLIATPIIQKLSALSQKKYVLLFGALFIAMGLLYYVEAMPILSGIQWLFENKLHADHIILPIGISFFTFTQIAFLVDVYLKKASEYRFSHYALFVSYYPHLLAGPIIHHAEMMPQFISKRRKVINYRNIYRGLALFTLGLFKKIVMADTFALWANNGYAHVGHLGALQAWATVLSYTFQLYFDFSGYTDMAIGISLLFNIQLPINFNSPYKSLNIQEFWRRWHITLSRFLKNYLYIFIGGNRVPQIKILRNFIIVFLVGGIWHGAGWTFIIWGLMHGVALSVCHLWQRLNIAIPKGLAWFITFSFINIAWIFFRAPSMSSALSMLQDCFDFQHVTVINPLIVLSILMAFVVCLFVRNSNELIVSKVMAWRIAPVLLGSAFLMSIYILLIRNSSAFLYFQF